LAGAGGIEPRHNPLLYKDFSIPARPFDSIFDSKAKALVGMTDDEVAYIEAKGWTGSAEGQRRGAADTGQSAGNQDD
jgi:hypothetical protein